MAAAAIVRGATAEHAERRQMPGVLGNPDTRRGIALGIKVEDQHPLADGGQGGTEIDGCGGLAHTTF